MRLLFGSLAVVLGAISIALAARYGYKGADTVVDGVIAAVMCGAIALCAFLFDGAAVRLWFYGHRFGAVAIGLIAFLALIVTFTNSLGAIAARGDATLAQRSKTVDTRKENRAELARLTAERAAMIFTPATAETVSAAREAVKAAERTSLAECGNGNPKQRGKNCRDREIDEAKARTALTAAAANKAATDRAAQLAADIRALRGRLDGGQAVANPNPLGAALGIMLGMGAAAVTAWQQAVVAAVLELCLVGVMVTLELLGHRKAPTRVLAAAPTVGPAPQPVEATVIPPARPALPPPRRARGKAVSIEASSVKAYLRDHLFPADTGERMDIMAMVRSYRAWCTEKGVPPADLDAILDDIEQLCGRLGVKIEPGDDQRVYVHGVKIASSALASVH